MKTRRPLCDICKNVDILKSLPNNYNCLANQIFTSAIKKKCEKFKIKEEKDFTIIVDTKEQKPWYYSKLNNKNFPNLKYINQSLKTGDYSLIGFSNPEEHKKTITIERKEVSDLFKTLGSGRDRFVRELERMEKFTFAVIVIEGGLREILRNPPEYSEVPPSKIIRSLIAFQQRYGVGFVPCTNRSQAEKLSFIMLDRFYKDHIGSFSKNGTFKPGIFSLDEGV